MAPNLQQRLQDAWDNASAAVLAQPGPFDRQTHLSNFLQNLVHRSSSPQHHHSSFRLHFPFPFAGLFVRESKSRSTSTSQTVTQSHVASSNGDLYNHKQMLITKDGEKGLQSSNRGHSRSKEEHVRDGDGTRRHENPINIPSEPQLLQKNRGHYRSEEEHVGDGTRGHENPINIPSELQLLQKQLETSALGSSGPASKEVLGRATWTFLHTLAAQFPEKPTRQQQRDAKELMAILSRLYPCKECADHFKEVLKANPVQTGSGVELAEWMCTVHNVINRSLGKSLFPCQRVDARWGAMDCDEGACSLQGRMH